MVQCQHVFFCVNSDSEEMSIKEVRGKCSIIEDTHLRKCENVAA